MALSMPGPANPPPIRSFALRPGLRVAVACSGGADSVALLRTLVELRGTLGIVLSVAHMNHGIRGAAAVEDQAFVTALADRFDLSAQLRQVDTPGVASSHRAGLEETARDLRYTWFWELLATGELDAVVTAHTLNDQSETVLHRLIRGAWTEGLGGIHPVLYPPSKQNGLILRPFLSATRAGIETWLREIAQPWREDATNLDTAFTRNRIRHELLPALVTYNPAISGQLAQLAALARDEEAYWQSELARLLPSLLLPGKAVRGGGRATGTLSGVQSLSIEIERLRGLHPALRRRVLRSAALQLGVALDFDGTERLLDLCGLAGNAVSATVTPSQEGRRDTPPRLQIANGLRAERTPREVKLIRADPAAPPPAATTAEYLLSIPGTVEAPEFGLFLEAALGSTPEATLAPARLRAGRPGDRVTLRYSRSRLKLKEAFQRSRLPLPVPCPVLEWMSEIVWVPGLVLASSSAMAAVLTVNSKPIRRDSVPGDDSSDTPLPPRQNSRRGGS